MKFLQKDKLKKSILVISDLHLGAGHYFDNKRNFLEDFHSDSELVDFLSYYSSGEFSNKDVELVINGDFVDLLAVPFVPYFDDEFWSDKCALDRLKIIHEAHQEVFEALNNFVSSKNKSITYIIGNHDAELIFPKLQEYFLSIFSEEFRNRVKILENEDESIYSPADGVAIKHGHDYEVAHKYSSSSSLVSNDTGELYFLPPWGSYYVTRVVNKYKSLRTHVDAVKPVKRFLINGLIYDTFFTLRFLIATINYFVMIRFIQFFAQEKNIRKVISGLRGELELFKDYESLTEDFLQGSDKYQVLVVGHTHLPTLRSYNDGSTFINTGTWTKVFNLGFVREPGILNLSYAQINIVTRNNTETIDSHLRIWKGRNEWPFRDFR